eukprot:CAMPEP_0113585896 /NCGR_PEP_ID=MMETSP0015_2-20120614/33981_1 /TAXON_ID=2838 /ORGANISM="Odontella" /LENGTH=72 /DNA_ID=CAMNT_0000491243 /DNA_START=583 /DNA_END=798 /DNA_ORIENTATION=- /assembly_acc=CAM_ASM_000160
MPVTRGAVDSKKIALRSIGNYLSSSWPSSSKLLVVRLLVASQTEANTAAKLPSDDALNFVLGYDMVKISLDQ